MIGTLTKKTFSLRFPFMVLTLLLSLLLGAPQVLAQSFDTRPISPPLREIFTEGRSLRHKLWQLSGVFPLNNGQVGTASAQAFGVYLLHQQGLVWLIGEGSGIWRPTINFHPHTTYQEEASSVIRERHRILWKGDGVWQGFNINNYLPLTQGALGSVLPNFPAEEWTILEGISLGEGHFFWSLEDFPIPGRWYDSQGFSGELPFFPNSPIPRLDDQQSVVSGGLFSQGKIWRFEGDSWEQKEVDIGSNSRLVAVVEDHALLWKSGALNWQDMEIPVISDGSWPPKGEPHWLWAGEALFAWDPLYQELHILEPSPSPPIDIKGLFWSAWEDYLNRLQYFLDYPTLQWALEQSIEELERIRNQDPFAEEISKYSNPWQTWLRETRRSIVGHGNLELQRIPGGLRWRFIPDGRPTQVLSLQIQVFQEEAFYDLATTLGYEGEILWPEDVDDGGEIEIRILLTETDGLISYHQSILGGS